MGKARKEPLSRKRNKRNLKKKFARISKTIATIKAIELTCCGDEITGMVKDIGICPTCLEYI
jgi:hypothetical protein